jgi:hypoxanthine phosphoribosyltransferase
MYKELLCTLITWKDIYRLCRQLARQLREANFRVDVIVAIA